MTSDPVVLTDTDGIEKIFKETDTLRIPVFAYDSVFIDYGAVLMISADIPTIGRQAADFAQDILAKSELDRKIESPAGSSIMLNMKKVIKYGINLNRDALDSVNELIK